MHLKKKEDGNVKVVNMITRKNESKSLTEHISCDGKCRFDGGKFNLNQIWNNGKCRCNLKNHWMSMYVRNIVCVVLINVPVSVIFIQVII